MRKVIAMMYLVFVTVLMFSGCASRSVLLKDPPQEAPWLDIDFDVADHVYQEDGLLIHDNVVGFVIILNYEDGKYVFENGDFELFDQLMHSKRWFDRVCLKGEGLDERRLVEIYLVVKHQPKQVGTSCMYDYDPRTGNFNYRRR